MNRPASGTYNTTAVGGETVRAFVRTGLPPAPPLDLTGQRQRLLERATLALGRLDSVSALLPDPQLFLYAYVRREAVLSSQIEGTQSSPSRTKEVNRYEDHHPLLGTRSPSRHLSQKTQPPAPPSSPR